MTDLCFGGDQLPIPTPSLKLGSDFDIKGRLHGFNFAKFCGSYAQHFAHATRKTLRVQKKSVIQVVADSLAWHMDKQKISANVLGPKAGVSPRTIGNFLKPDDRAKGKAAKPPSGKVGELEMIARALGLEVSDLVVDMSEEARLERHRMALALRVLQGDADAIRVAGSGERGALIANRRPPKTG